MTFQKAKPYLYLILLSLGVGGLSGFLSRNGMKAFEEINQPALTPPTAVFPVVWTVLFILMGIGAAMVFSSRSLYRDRALAVFFLQLTVNFFWSILFFNLRAYLFSFFWLLLLWSLILRMLRQFYRVNRAAGLLQVPYLLWVSFAGYLNLAVWYLNR